MFGRSKNIAWSLLVLTALFIFSLSLVRIAAAQTNTSLGQAHSLATGAASIPPSDSMHSLLIASATTTPPLDSRRSLATPRAFSTLPPGSTQCFSTPRATPIPPSEPLRSF